MNDSTKILFLGKKKDDYCIEALALLESQFTHVSSALGAWQEPFPEKIENWQGDYIISYLSRWIIPEKLLCRAKIAAINFHPGTPHYPGIGCNNFALYDNALEYGSTCHFMHPKVDTGEIIDVTRFNVNAADTVETLLQKTYKSQFELFQYILQMIISGKTLTTSDEKWLRKPFTRKEFNELCELSPDMTKNEMTKRIRATHYRSWKPTLVVHGFTFELKVPDLNNNELHENE